MDKEERVYKGYWWRPLEPKKRVAGVLTYSGDKIVVEIIGSFYDEVGDIMACHKEPIIYGIDSNAKEITLVDCTGSLNLNFSSEFPIVRYTCQRIIYDRYIDGLDKKEDYTASLCYPELSFWAHPGSISFALSAEGNMNLAFSTESKSLLSVDISDNTKLELVGNVSFNGGDSFLSPNLAQYTLMRIERNGKISISEIENYRRRFAEFLSIAFLKDVECNRVFLTSPDNVQIMDEEKKFYFPIDVYWPHHAHTNSISHKDCLFTLDDICSNAAVIIKNWMTCSSDMHPIVSHLVGSMIRKNSFSSVDFLSVSQAIEGFWWRFRDNDYKVKNKIPKKQKTNLNTILSELLAEYSSIPAIMNLNLDVHATADSRNYYSHFLPDGAKQNVKYGLELYRITKDLRKLLFVIVASMMGFTTDQIDRALANLK